MTVDSTATVTLDFIRIGTLPVVHRSRPIVAAVAARADWRCPMTVGAIHVLPAVETIRAGIRFAFDGFMATWAERSTVAGSRLAYGRNPVPTVAERLIFDDLNIPRRSGAVVPIPTNGVLFECASHIAPHQMRPPVAPHRHRQRRNRHRPGHRKVIPCNWPVPQRGSRALEYRLGWPDTHARCQHG